MARAKKRTAVEDTYDVWVSGYQSGRKDAIDGAVQLVRDYTGLSDDEKRIAVTIIKKAIGP